MAGVGGNRRRPGSAGNTPTGTGGGAAGGTGFGLTGSGFTSVSSALGGAASTQFCVSPCLFDVCGLLFDPPSGITVQAILHLPAHSALRSHITALEWLTAATTTLGLKHEAGLRIFEAFYCLSLKKEARLETTRHTLAAINQPSAAARGATGTPVVSTSVGGTAAAAAYSQYAMKRVVSMPGLMIFLMAQVFLERPPRYPAGEQHHDQFVAFVKQHIAEIVATVSVTRPGKVHVGELQELRLLFREFANGSEVAFGSSLATDLFTATGNATQPDGSVDASTVAHYIRGRLFSANEVRGAVATTTMTHRNIASQTVVIHHAAAIKPHCSLKLQRNSQSTFYVLTAAPNTVLSSLTNCVVVLGAVGGLLVIDRCEQCHIIAAASAIVISSCRFVVLNVCTNLPPIFVGGNEGVTIGPFNTFYPGLEEHLATAAVNPELSLFDVNLPAGCKQEPSVYMPFSIPVPASATAAMQATTRTNPCHVPQEYLNAVASRKAKITELSSALRDTYKQLEAAGRKDLAAGLRSRVQGAFAQWLQNTGQIQGLVDLLHNSSLMLSPGASAAGGNVGAQSPSAATHITAQPPSTAASSATGSRPSSGGTRR